MNVLSSERIVCIFLLGKVKLEIKSGPKTAFVLIILIVDYLINVIFLVMRLPFTLRL